MTSRSIITRYYPALGVPDFRTLWLATVPAILAFHFGLVTSGYAAVQLSDAAVVVGIVGGAWGVPLVAIPLVGGVAADRLPRRRIMLISQSIQAVSVGIVAALAATGALEVWHLVVLGLIQGTSFAFTTPARVAYAADAVGGPLMPSAIGAHYASLTLGSIVGPAIAGALLVVPTIGIPGTYAVIALLYAACVVGLLRLPERTAERAADQGSAARRLVDGLVHIRSTPPLTTLLGIGATSAFLGMPFIPLMPLYAERVFAAGSAGLGLLLAASGLGSLVGALAAGAVRSRTRLSRLLPALGPAFGLALVALALAPTFDLGIVAAFTVGLAGSSLSISTNSLVITTAAPAYYGRVWSVNQLTFGLGAVGAIALGALADVVGPRAATATGGVALAVIVAMLAITARRAIAGAARRAG